MPYQILIDDNFNYMDESERTTGNKFETADEALAEARRIVDDCLFRMLEPGTTASELYESYISFGEDPFISSENAPAVSFSAWTYAKSRCEQICSGEIAEPPLQLFDPVEVPQSEPQQVGGPRFVIGKPDARYTSRIVWRGATMVERTGSWRRKPKDENPT